MKGVVAGGRFRRILPASKISPGGFGCGLSLVKLAFSL
jgi:hypothetical protein